MSRVVRFFARPDSLSFVVVALVSAWLAITLTSRVMTDTGLPRWDEAKYGLDAARVADALRRDAPLDLARTIHGMSVWPPLVPTVNGLAMLVAGPGINVPRVASAIWVCLIPFVLWLAARLVDPTLGGPAAALAAAGWAGGIQVQVLGALGMLEAAGALAGLTALWLRLRAFESRRLRPNEKTVRPWALAWAATTAVFLVKSNYGFLWALPVVLHEARMAAVSWREVGSRLQRSIQKVRWWRPLPLLVVLGAVSSLVLLVLGGVDLEIGDWHLRSRSPGNPLVYVWAVVLLRIAVTPRTSWRRFSQWRSGLSIRWRAALDLTLIPLLVWWSMPPHLKDLAAFLDNRSSGVPLWDLRTLAYPWRALADGYSSPFFPGEWFGAVAVLAGCVWIWRSDRSGRSLLALASLIGLVAVWVHPYQQTRFLFTVAPLLFLAGVLASATLVRRMIGTRVALAGTLLGCVFLLTGISSHRIAMDQQAEKALAAWTAPASHLSALTRLFGLASGRHVLVAGLWNGFSPALVEWGGVVAGWNQDHDVQLEGWGKTSDQRVEAALLERLGQQPAVDRLVILARHPRAADPVFDTETQWVDALRRGRFRGWSRPRRVSVPESGYILVIRARQDRSVPPSPS